MKSKKSPVESKSPAKSTPAAGSAPTTQSYLAFRTGGGTAFGMFEDLRRAATMIERDPRGGIIVDATGKVRTRVEPNYAATRKLHAELVANANDVIAKANADAAKLLTDAAKASAEVMARAAELAAWLEQHAPANQ